MAGKHRVYLTRPVLNDNGHQRLSIYLDDDRYEEIRKRATAAGKSVRAYVTDELAAGRHLFQMDVDTNAFLHVLSSSLGE
ncbi:MAG: hypothetical protein IKS61_02200 [Aeriscardovia sp.]|nr:hypothetical protein [Aeriscardovia sp.]